MTLTTTAVQNVIGSMSPFGIILGWARDSRDGLSGVAIGSTEVSIWHVGCVRPGKWL